MNPVDPLHVIHAQLETAGCSAELLVNDFPISVHPRGRAQFTSLAVQEFLIPGRNTLELQVEPEDPRATLPADTWARARLIKFREGVSTAEVEPASILAEASWPVKQGPEETPRRVKKAHVDMGEALGPWSWQGAPLLEPDEALIEEAHIVLEEAARLMTAGSLEQHLQFYDVKLRDALRAYPAMSEALLRERLGKMLAYDARSGGHALPLSRAQHDFRLAAGGRVLHCVEKDGLPSLRFREPSGDVLLCKTFLARIGARLRVVR